MKNQKKIIAVVGPTASGKTGLGVAIAKKYSAKGGPASGWNGAEIISADSRQVFRKLNIGTGKDLNEYGDIKYHLIDICDPGEKFTMFDWLERAKIIIDDIFSRGKLPVLVGGTGLYVQALVEGFTLEKVESKKRYSSIVSNKVRDLKVKSFGRDELNSMSLAELQSILKKLETSNYKLETVDINNPRRLIREIEKAQGGEVPGRIKPDFDVLQVLLDYPREELYARIDQRVEEWFSEGFYEEVENLLKSGVTDEWLKAIGLEYKILAAYITGCHPELVSEPALNSIQGSLEIPDPHFAKATRDKQARNDSQFEQMKQEMKYKIHKYARRQLTWWRRFSEVVWVKSKKEAFVSIDDFLGK